MLSSLYASLQHSLKSYTRWPSFKTDALSAYYSLHKLRNLELQIRFQISEIPTYTYRPVDLPNENLV